MLRIFTTLQKFIQWEDMKLAKENISLSNLIFLFFNLTLTTLTNVRLCLTNTFFLFWLFTKLCLVVE